MTRNRIQELLRDPTLESPSREYFEVRLPWIGFCVPRESAQRLLEAMVGLHPVDWVQIQTVEGSVVYVRVEHVVFVREWTPAQRETGRQFWKQIDQEYEEKEDGSGDGPEAASGDGSPSIPGPPAGARQLVPGVGVNGRISPTRAFLIVWAAWVLLRLVFG